MFHEIILLHLPTCATNFNRFSELINYFLGCFLLLRYLFLFLHYIIGVICRKSKKQRNTRVILNTLAILHGIKELPWLLFVTSLSKSHSPSLIKTSKHSEQNKGEWVPILKLTWDNSIKTAPRKLQKQPCLHWTSPLSCLQASTITQVRRFVNMNISGIRFSQYFFHPKVGQSNGWYI